MKTINLIILILSVLVMGLKSQPFAGDDVFSKNQSVLPKNIFYNNWLPSPVQSSFQLENYIVWGGSVIKAENGKYYMFASRWPTKLTFRAWVTNSEIVLASSNTPEGPYKFEKVILPARKGTYWDGKATHNPSIHYHEGMYILFYTGVTYDFNQPLDSAPNREMYEKAWNNKRIGIAVAESVYGPWNRSDHPIIEPREGMWDAAITSNAAPVIHKDGSVMLVYKSAPFGYPKRNTHYAMNLGVARASHFLGPYKRVEEDNQINIIGLSSDVEDPYVWYADGYYHMLAKSMDEKVTGENGGGFYAFSKNGMNWEFPDYPTAYGRKVSFENGKEKMMKRLERAQVLFENGKPTHVYFACMTQNKNCFNVVRPLKAN